MNRVCSVVKKEFNAFFASPAAWLFLAAFLIVTLFVFFWAEAFFARNIADLKPLFEWMPVLLIFLVGALTMRSWSEERRSGTLENLLTSPVSAGELILGKFFASLLLVVLALALTLPIAVTVYRMGPLDTGPVIGGYLASLFLAAAYIAIGLYMSARTDNPIVALILTVASTGALYLIGSPIITNLFGHQVSGVLELIGSGSRFKSITRGVLDLRDIYYYISLVGIFLILNRFALERFRWAGNPAQKRHGLWCVLTLLVGLNFALPNLWLNSVGWARLDLTENKSYSLSASTKQYLQQAREPLFIKGYFSSKSHPLLEPLVPQLKDLLEEYHVAGGSQVQVEFVDPHTDPKVEEEAAEKYGIHPVPFRMANRYEAGVVNSYFDLVIAYGDQYETLSFDDLIEVKAGNTGEPEVLLRDPEYAITSAVRKVINGYQAGGDIFSDLSAPVVLHGYITKKSELPEGMDTVRDALEKAGQELAGDSKGQFKLSFEDPGGGDGALGKRLQEKYGFGPQVASLFNPQPFWFYIVLESGDQTLTVPLPEETDAAGFKQAIEAALQRMAPGYLKTVALVAPKSAMGRNPYMPTPSAGKQYENLKAALRENVRLIEPDLSSGKVPADTDLLLLLSPSNLSEKAVFAVDQFLMSGGSVVVATSPFDVSIQQSLDVAEAHSGLEDWLAHNGLTVKKELVLDPQNASLPIPVQRYVGGIPMREIVMMPYPHFPDIRRDGLNSESPITSGFSQMTLDWVSPLTLDKEANAGRDVTRLLESSSGSWTSTEKDVMPDYQAHPRLGFTPAMVQAPSLLAVAVEGTFSSYFEGKDSPLLPDQAPDQKTKGEDSAESKADVAEDAVLSHVIQTSSDSARLVVIGSNSFAEDRAIDLMSQGQGTLYTNQYDFLQNVIDWSLGDEGLLSIRGRGRFARTLEPMQQEQRLYWEYCNYAAAMVGLILIWTGRYLFKKKKQQHYRMLLQDVG